METCWATAYLKRRAAFPTTSGDGQGAWRLFHTVRQALLAAIFGARPAPLRMGQGICIRTVLHVLHISDRQHAARTYEKGGPARPPS